MESGSLSKQQQTKPAESSRTTGSTAAPSGHRHTSKSKPQDTTAVSDIAVTEADPQLAAAVSAVAPLAIAATSLQPQVIDGSSQQNVATDLFVSQAQGVKQNAASGSVALNNKAMDLVPDQQSIRSRVASASEPTGLQQKAAPSVAAGEDEHQPKPTDKDAKRLSADAAPSFSTPQSIPVQTPVPSSSPVLLPIDQPMQAAAASTAQFPASKELSVRQATGTATKAPTMASALKRPAPPSPKALSELVGEVPQPESDVQAKAVKIPAMQEESTARTQAPTQDAIATQPPQVQPAVSAQPQVVNVAEGAAPSKEKVSATKPLSNDADVDAPAAAVSQKEGDRFGRPRADGDILPTGHAGQSFNPQAVSGVTVSRTGASFSTSLHTKVSEVAASASAMPVQAAPEAPGVRHQVEVGFHDSTLGWLSVRATSGNDGALHLAMAGRADSAGTVDRMMPSLQHFLQDHEVRAHSLTYAQQAEPTINAASGSSANYANAQTASQGNDRSGMGERQQRSLAGSERQSDARQERSEQKGSYRERPLAVSDVALQGRGLLSIRI